MAGISLGGKRVMREKSVSISGVFQFDGVTCELTFRVSPEALAGLNAGSSSEDTADALEDIVHSLAPDTTRQLCSIAKSFRLNLLGAYANLVEDEHKATRDHPR